MRNSLLLVTCLLLVGCMPRHTRPLDLSLDASAGLASGDDVGNPVGAGVRLGLDWLALSASMGVADARGFGRPCAGLIDPDEPACAEQPLAQESEIVRGSFGYVATKEFGRNRFVLSPYVGVAYVAHEERGMHTGATRDAAAAGWQLGTRVGLQRNVASDLWVGVSADAALIMPIRFECADCYDPFREDIFIGSLSLSASWRLP